MANRKLGLFLAHLLGKESGQRNVCQADFFAPRKRELERVEREMNGLRAERANRVQTKRGVFFSRDPVGFPVKALVLLGIP